tara:strand:- start:647 stop:1159 length:513 start_codon:yes stop_codon:yes gene_type:complete
MDLEQAAFIAEVISGIGVILSLAYLTSEVRRSTRQAQQDSMALLTTKRTEIMYQVTENPELAMIVWRCLSGARVPAYQWARYSLYLSTTMVTIEMGFKKIWANEVDAVTAKTWKEGADFWFKYPGMRTWWKAGQIGYSDMFCAYIDERLKVVEVDGRDAEQIVASLPVTD